MRYKGIRYILSILLLLVSANVYAQGVGPAPGVGLNDEGVVQGRVQILNCVGAGVVCTKSGVTGVVTISGAAGSFYATVQEESVSLTQRATLNFLGANMTCVDNGGTLATDCTITGGGGGANVVEASLTITGNTPFWTTTVVGQAWVTATSKIVCQPFATTADGESLELYSVAALVPIAANRVLATGFDIRVTNPNGATGIFRFQCTGA